MAGAAIEISGVRKSYAALRPFRLAELVVLRGERVAISGIDAAGAELLVNLVTGATLPDEGQIATFGTPTVAIQNGDAWLASLDRFGIVSTRGVLLDGSTLEQNLALPFTLDIDPVPEAVVQRVAQLARDCRIRAEDLPRPVGELPAHVRMRAHLARAVALGPELLLVEHPTAGVADAERPPLGRDMAAVADSLGASALFITMDVDFAEAAAHRMLALQPATGALVPWKKKRGWFR